MKKWIMLICLIFPLSVLAVDDFYHFDSKQEQERFITLTNQFRCLVCQNQTIAESNATLAVDLRKQVYEKILLGQNDQEIIHYLVARYGDFVLFKPPLNGLTIGLWFGPFILLMVGIGYLLYYIKKSNRDKS